MNEYKVLGASERNLKAIEMALSNNGSISTNGSVKADFHYKEEIEMPEGGGSIDLPSGHYFLLSTPSGTLSGFNYDYLNPISHSFPLSAGNYALVCLSGQLTWLEIKNCE